MIRDKYGMFWSGSGDCEKLIATCRRFPMKCITATRALTGGILKILNLSVQYCKFIWSVRVYLPVAVTGDEYCIFGGVQGVENYLL